MFNDDNFDEPRHLSTGKCLCQFIEEHFKYIDKNDIDGCKSNRMTGMMFNDEFVDLESNGAACDDFSSSDESSTTGTLDGAKLGTQIDRCVQIDIGKLAAEAAAASVVHSANSIGKTDVDSLRIFISDCRDLDYSSGSDYTCKPIVSMNTISNDSYAPNPSVPTLSQLVSLKERGTTLADLERQTDSTSPVNTELSFDTTTIAFDGLDPLIKNDDLIKKLKDLLELTKNELSHCSSLNTNQHLQRTGLATTTNQWVSSQDKKFPLANTKGETENSSTTSAAANGSNNLKKFFSQTTDGFSFLSTGKQKQQYQGFYIQQQQSLEIC